MWPLIRPLTLITGIQAEKGHETEGMLARIFAMAVGVPQDITALLTDWGNGEKEALDSLMPIVYPEADELPGSTWPVDSRLRLSNRRLW